MATINHSTQQGISKIDAYVVSWQGFGTGDQGQAFEQAGHADRTIQVIGTIDGTTITIQGSLDGTNWETLSDVFGNALVFTTVGMAAIAELTPYIRPVSSGGTAPDVDVLLFVKRGDRFVAH